MIIEKLKELGLSDDDLIMIESTMSTRIDEAAEVLAKELLETERSEFESRVIEIQEAFQSQFSEYSEVVIQQLDEKYKKKIEDEVRDIKEQQTQIVSGFINEFDAYGKVLVESLEAKYKSEFEDTARSIVESFTESLDGYSASIVEEFKEGAGSQSALKVEMADALIESIKGIYGKFNVAVPEGINLEEEYNNFVTESEQTMNQLSEENKALKAQVQNFTKAAILAEASSDLTIIQQESLKELSESLLYVSKDQFKSRVLQLKEKFLSGTTDQQKRTTSVPAQQKPESNTHIDISKYVTIQTRK